MPIQFLLDRFKENTDLPAIIWQNKIINYRDLLDKYESAKQFILTNGINQGEVISLTGDFTPNSIALLLALIQNKNIVVPFNAPIKESEQTKFKIAEVEKGIVVDTETDNYTFQTIAGPSTHEFYKLLRERQTPGLVLFTSGTSGFPKGAVHDFSKLLEKFKSQRTSLRTINFLLFDHWGGLNTLFHTLSNCGVVMALKNRKPEVICEYIQNYKIELLPVSPSFLNLLILSEAYKNYDLSSLKLITYGTEPMPLHTLKRAKEIFPEINFQQTYGLIELGVLRSKSKNDDSNINRFIRKFKKRPVWDP